METEPAAGVGIDIARSSSMHDELAALLARLPHGLVEDLLWVYEFDRTGCRRHLLSGRGPERVYKIDGARELMALGLAEAVADGLTLTGLGCDVVRALRAAERALEA